MKSPIREYLFVAISEYLVPERVVLDALVEHRAWTKQAFDNGIMLFTGRQDPPEGGVLCFQAPDREWAQVFIDSDPFVIEGIVKYRLIPVNPTPAPWRSKLIEQFLASRALSDAS